MRVILGRLAAASALAVGCWTLMAAGSASAALNAYKPPNYTFPSGFQGFKLVSHGGDFNPGVLVGFNPQPEPPGNRIGDAAVGDFSSRTLIGLFRPTDPILNNPSDGGAFNFLIALLDVGDGFLVPAVEPPNSDGHTGFHTFAGGHDISINLQFGGSEITSWSWGAFNPQPDPPGDWGGGVIGFAADPFMSFNMTVDGQHETFTLAGVPEPASWALMIMGFGATGALLRTRRRSLARA